jgi:hypothetical protein
MHEDSVKRSEYRAVFSLHPSSAYLRVSELRQVRLPANGNGKCFGDPDTVLRWHSLWVMPVQS